MTQFSQPWLHSLQADPLPWLLEPQNPSVRFWTLVDLLDRPPDDPEVQDARRLTAAQPLVEQLIALQQPEGGWGPDPASQYTAQGAVTVLSLLFMFGVEPDERTRAGCQAFLRASQSKTGGFSLALNRPSGVFPCTTGEHLPFLVYFGLGGDPQVRRAFEYLVADMSGQDALDCGRYAHQECLWGAIAALNGLAVLPPDMHSDRSEMAVRRLADALLDASYDFSGEHKRWLTFGVPRLWDLLSALKALAAHGYAADPRFAPLLERLLERQDEAGRWLCGSTSRTWPLEKRSRPSKWVTLDALRLLRLIYAARPGA